MFIQFGDQQLGWIKGGFFMLGRTAFRPPFGPYSPQDEAAFLQRYLRQLELELHDVDDRLAALGHEYLQPVSEAPAAPAARETAAAAS